MIDRTSLLVALVGEEGASALAKAAKRLPEIDNAMVPRALYAWLSVAGTGYDGPIPGVIDSALLLSKSEVGYSGAVHIEGVDYHFSDSSLLHVSAAVGTLGGLVDHRVDPRVTDEDLYRLGRTVDVLVKARIAHAAMTKKEATEYNFEHEHDATKSPAITTVYALHGDKEVGKAVVLAGGKVRSWTVDKDHPTLEMKMQDVVRQIMGGDLEKASDEGTSDGAVEGPGPAHKPTAPAEPIPPDGPTHQTAQPPKNAKGKRLRAPKPTPTTIPGLPKLKLSEKQIAVQCVKCHGQQLDGEGKFVGCWCFKDLGRYVKLSKSDGDVSLSFGAEWNEDALLALFDSLKLA